jgi:hypothetical protein
LCCSRCNALRRISSSPKKPTCSLPPSLPWLRTTKGPVQVGFIMVHATASCGWHQHYEPHHSTCRRLHHPCVTLSPPLKSSVRASSDDRTIFHVRGIPLRIVPSSKPVQEIVTASESTPVTLSSFVQSQQRSQLSQTHSTHWRESSNCSLQLRIQLAP